MVFLSDEWDGGSSPLARGLHEPVDWADMEYGIIPARAGFTRAGSARRSARADHPRSRGVYGWETRIVLKKQFADNLDVLAEFIRYDCMPDRAREMEEEFHKDKAQFRKEMEASRREVEAWLREEEEEDKE